MGPGHNAGDSRDNTDQEQDFEDLRCGKRRDDDERPFDDRTGARHHEDTEKV